MIEAAPVLVGAVCAVAGYLGGQYEAARHYRAELLDARLAQQRWQKRFRQLAEHGRLFVDVDEDA